MKTTTFKTRILLEKPNGLVVEEFCEIDIDFKIKVYLDHGSSNGRDSFQKIKTTGKGEYLMIYGERNYIRNIVDKENHWKVFSVNDVLKRLNIQKVETVVLGKPIRHLIFPSNPNLQIPHPSLKKLNNLLIEHNLSHPIFTKIYLNHIAQW